MSVGWDRIDFQCRELTPADGELCVERVAPAMTAEAVKAMAMDHFPEGPASAVASLKAYEECQRDNAMIFFTAEKDRPQIAPEGRRWRAFVKAWDNFAAAEQWMSGRFHAEPQLRGSLNLGRQVAEQSSWA